jgi:hypothetical protein
MAEARLRTLSAVTTGALLLVGALLFAASGWAVGSVVIAAILVMVGQLVTVPTPSGERLHLALGAAAALVLIVEEPLAAGAGFMLGMAAASGVAISRGDEHGSNVVTETVALALFTAVYYLIVGLAPASWQGHSLELTAIATAGLAWYAGRAATRTVVGMDRDDVSIRYVWLLAIEDWSVGVSILAAGALFGLTFPEMRWWAIPVAMLPYAFSHLAFVRDHDTRITYGQTIRALAQIPEVAGLAPEGHAARTAELSIAVAREVGLHPRRIASLEYAALMHDIGRITLNEPAILRAGYTDEDIARWGAQIIAEAPYLERVSYLVAEQYRPFRTPGVAQDPEIPIESKIIKTASSYDKAVHERNLSPVEALEQLHRGSAYDFDPSVTASLRRVLVHRGAVNY